MRMSDLRQMADELPIHAMEYTDQDIRLAAEIVDEWLKEHPADDDEPVTGEWLESIGFWWSDSGRFIHDSTAPGPMNRVLLDLEMGCDGCYVQSAGKVSVRVNAPMPETRRDVRQLLSALGHESRLSYSSFEADARAYRKRVEGEQ